MICTNMSTPPDIRHCRETTLVLGTVDFKGDVAYRAAMDGELRIRHLEETDDLDAFGRLVLASYLAEPGMPRESDYDSELLDVSSRVRDGTVLGAFVGDGPTGCVTFVADASSPHAERLRPGESSFRMLAVDTAAQGRGVGEALVRRCLDDAARLGSSAVFIHSGSWMHTAHRLYLRLGFEFVPERDWVIDGTAIHLLGMMRTA
jgi:ribosomal protein S18 acetylase RimI-like enzyme